MFLQQRVAILLPLLLLTTALFLYTEYPEISFGLGIGVFSYIASYLAFNKRIFRKSQRHYQKKVDSRSSVVMVLLGLIILAITIALLFAPDTINTINQICWVVCWRGLSKLGNHKVIDKRFIQVVVLQPTSFFRHKSWF